MSTTFLGTLLSTLIGYSQLAGTELRCLASAIRPARGKPVRVGLIVRDFAPAITGGVYRPAALARHLVQAGMEVEVLAVTGPEVPTPAGLQLLEQIGAAVLIHRIPESTRVTSYRFFPRVDGGLLNAVGIFDHARKIWRADPPQVLIASGPPFHTFIAGYHLARYLGSKLILDYRDEWSLNPFDFVRKEPQDREWEARCLARADLVTVTTASQRDLLGKTYPGTLVHKCEVIANGWESEGEPSRGAVAPPGDERALFLFAGKLGGHTDPERFLAALAVVLREHPGLERKLVVRFVGNKTPATQEALARFPFPGVVESHPLVPLHEVQAMMGAADALLLFHDERFERYLPGKLYEYLAARRPVLLLDDRGESTRLVQSLKAGWSMQSCDVAAIHAMVLNVLELKSRREKEGVPENPDLDRWLQANTRARMAARFQGEIERLLGR
ncbi:MAG: glycosyltransferase [Azonexus sp.]|nr:glycosyltransferase [Betaproteobacteria bacterium]MBP6035790.1 glycosyltransferase [Azonexus sp.]MBP6905427.1 glycosyltransferase [Azonexus sp.]